MSASSLHFCVDFVKAIHSNKLYSERRTKETSVRKLYYQAVGDVNMYLF